MEFFFHRVFFSMEFFFGSQTYKHVLQTSFQWKEQTLGKPVHEQEDTTVKFEQRSKLERESTRHAGATLY